ncbi:tetratricopeptide repeat protein [Paractinoplanes abujensis]|uniref:Class 3 adenylate cyclase/tetratricopeptide (TPR) repeat protein n=1 Tax=Paractinoplanes abujensis TaxID=882441 RepID=A0A7W7CSN5_9ACTN|nr:tetratricopeptide repeat protein [Actinoplanes abujensis]MBB4693958.1 class 3 adenylate cyclase/tetratricopeptide (TPR) repeat protein [Actinoplanes abujensis]
MPELAATWRSYLPEHVLRILLTTDNVSIPPVTQRAEAVILYADVVGFTAMAESFSGSGSYGTEQLTRIINRWFEVTADAIAASGGSVVDFAGDALVGMFEYTPATAAAVARRAIHCAELIREATASVVPISTRDGSRSLTIRVGMAAGSVLAMLLGDPATRLQHVIAGPALDAAIDALHRAERGEIVIDSALQKAAEPGESIDPPYAPPAPPAGELERLVKPFLHPAIRTRLSSGRHELVNEHRKVTTAFVRLPDVSMDKPETVQALQRYLDAGVRIIDRFGGHLRHLMADDKGTVLVAVFGTPVSHEDDEERALRCCLELLALPGGADRGGLTTGPVFCGEVGSDIRREYAVVGDAVNLAARLMQAAPPGHLLIDQSTFEHVREVVVADGPVLVTAKGKSRPVPSWVVRSVQEADLPSELPSPAPGALVGRATEMARLEQVVREVRSGRGRVVWLHGEAGIGKSRLAAETCRITGTLGFTGYGGSCRSHGTSASYLVWRSIWRELLEIDSSLPLDEQRSMLTERVTRYDGSGQRAPLLAALIDLPMPDTDLTAQLDQSGRDELLRSTLLACLRERAATGPLVLLLEDCHWIDPASLGLLDLLAGHLDDLPVLLLATSRELTPGTLSGADHVIEVPLTQMTERDARRLATLRLRERYGQGTEVAGKLVEQIIGQTGGNAFYIEELIAYLHGNRFDPADSAGLAALHLPDSLQRLVMARIDQLTDDEKAAIKVASVIGRRFQPPWIASVYPKAGSAQQVAVHLAHLDALDLTPRVADEPEPEYEFKHPITQETAYQSITYDTRSSLHERAALFIEDEFADRLTQYVDVLAHHYARTERHDKQRVWFRAAGDRAKSIFANEAANHYYGRLLPLLPEADQAALHIEIGTVHHHTGQWAEADRHYRLAMRAAEATGRLDIVAAGQRQLGDLLMYRSHADAVSWLKRALVGFQGLGDAAGLSRTMERMTYVLFRQGEYAEALAMAHQHLAMATEAGDLSAMSGALNHIGLCHLNTGRSEEALDHLTRAFETAEQARDRHWMLFGANNLGWAFQRNADHVQAIATYQRALDVAQDIGARHTAGITVGNMGEIYREEGDFGRARACAMHSLRLAVELRDWTTIVDQLTGLGGIAAAEGRLDEAEQLLERAIPPARELDSPYFLCEALHRLARLHLSAGRPALAETLNSEALAVAEEHDERDTQVNAYTLAVRLQVARGEVGPADAARSLREAAGRWSEPHEVAALMDAAWQANSSDDDARRTAAGIYEKLYLRAPRLEYRHAYRRLTGVRLPPGPPLPALPRWIVTENGPGLDVLLERIERAPRHNRAA